MLHHIHQTAYITKICRQYLPLEPSIRTKTDQSYQYLCSPIIPQIATTTVLQIHIPKSSLYLIFLSQTLFLRVYLTIFASHLIYYTHLPDKHFRISAGDVFYLISKPQVYLYLISKPSCPSADVAFNDATFSITLFVPQLTLPSLTPPSQ